MPKKTTKSRPTSTGASRKRRRFLYIRNRAFKEAKKYPVAVGEIVKSEAVPDYLGELIEIRDDGTALVDFDEIGFRTVPVDSCVDVDLVMKFVSSQEKRVPLASIDVPEFKKWSREEGQRLRSKEYAEMLEEQEQVRAGRRHGRYIN